MQILRKPLRSLFTLLTSAVLLAAMAALGSTGRIEAPSQRSEQSVGYRIANRYPTPVEPVIEDVMTVVRRQDPIAHKVTKIPNHHVEAREGWILGAAEAIDRGIISSIGEVGSTARLGVALNTLSAASPSADLQFDTNSYSGLNRPDSAIAAGPSHLVTAVNFAFQIQDLNGANPLSITLNGFFPQDPTRSIGDPRLSYDQASGRFIMSCLGFQYPANGAPPNTGDSWCDVAVSKTSDPRGFWYKYSFRVLRNSTEQMDFDSLGYDGKAIYITGRTRDFAKGTTVSGNRLIILDKARALAGEKLVPIFVDDLKLPGSTALAEIVKPVEPGEPVTQTSPAYFLCAQGSVAVALYTIHDPLGTPAFSGVPIPIPRWVNPSPAPQPGGPPVLIQAEGFPLQKTVIRGGVIWSCQSVSGANLPNNRAGILVYKIDPRTHALLESHWISDPALWYYQPAVVPDASGNAVVAFAGSDGSHFPSIYHARYVAATGKFERPVLTAPGSSSFNAMEQQVPQPQSQETWGDYIDAALDIASGGRKVWVHAELPATPTTWKMHAARIPSG